jgi:nicotinate dehydrogenase subunit B
MSSNTKQALPTSLQANPLLGSWIQFGKNQTLRVLSGKVEIGQGINISLKKIATLQLGVNPAQLDFIAGDTDICPDEWYTAGSQSIEVGGHSLAFACQHFRHLFTTAAAKKLSCKEAELTLANGIFSFNGQTVSYFDLQNAVDYKSFALDQVWTGDAFSLKGVKSSVDGFARDDLNEKIGGTGFIQDLVLPNMVHARVLRGPHAHAVAVDWQFDKLKALQGVEQVFVSGQFVALIGTNEAAIVAAYEKAQSLITWRAKKPLPQERAMEEFLPSLPAVVSEPIIEGAAKVGTTSHSARYSRPYIAHASMSPSCALAMPTEEESISVWSHTQGPHKLRDQLALALKMPAPKVRVIHVAGPGCYGHNGADDVAFDAAFLAQQLKRPVRVQWMRSDEMSAGPVGAASLVELAASLNDDGLIISWDATVWSHTHIARPGWGEGINLLGVWSTAQPVAEPKPLDMFLPAGGGLRNIKPYYDLPSLKVKHHFIPESPVRVSALRSLGAYANTFAIESFLDELAELSNQDPLAFRLKHQSDQRARDVLEKSAQMSNWKSYREELSSAQDGRGLGIGFGRYKNKSAFCAVVIEVEVTEVVKVNKVWMAVDAGEIVHYDALLNQVEGGIIQALSWSLKEEVHWNELGSTTVSWDDYPILNFDEVPAVEIALIDRPGEPGLGSGELAAGPIAGALANAITHALQIRPRHLPFTPDRLSKMIMDSN